MSTKVETNGVSAPVAVNGKDEPIDENNLFELFNSVNFNSSVTIQESEDDLDSEDGDDYGDDSTILSMATSRRSLLS